MVLGSGWVVQGHWSTRVVVHKRPFGSLKVPKVEGSVTVGLLIAVHVALVSSHSVDAAAAAADADADVDVDAEVDAGGPFPMLVMASVRISIRV